MHTSGWYYERARGQWENERAARLSPKAIRVFDLEYPRSQKLTKTDWAKYSYSWGRKPHLVSKGAQSVFAEYAKDVDAHWEKDDSVFGDAYFRNNVGKAIMYESLRSRVLGSAWYKEHPGYLANIVTYAIARFAEAVMAYRGGGYSYDFDRVWERQALSESTLEVMESIARLAQRHLTREDRQQANVTQWAKQQACWEGFRKTSVILGTGVERDLVSADSVRDRNRSQRQERKTDSGFEEVQRVLKTSDEVWRRAATLTQKGRISPEELVLIRKRAQSGSWVPQPFQAEKMMGALARLVSDGLLPRDVL